MTCEPSVVGQYFNARMHVRVPAMVFSVVAGIMLAGCGSGIDATTVNGRIAVKGKPVTHGIINFQAAGSRPLGGGINSDGTYSVQLPPADYQVRIDAPPQLPAGYKEGDPLPKLGPRLVPEKYGSFSTSGLTRTVGVSSPQSIDFNLQ